MKKNLKFTTIQIWLLLGLGLFTRADLHAQGTGFTYQGRLDFNGSPAAGNYDLTFTLFATNVSGSAIAAPATSLATPVTNGLFVATLDFGPGMFTGDARWLEIAVRTNGGGVFNPLAPRQQLAPTPYAIFAGSASNVLGNVPAGQVTGVILPAQLPGYLVTNNETGVALGGIFTGNGAGLTNLNASQLQTGVVPTNVLAGFQAPYYAFIGGGQNNTANNTYAVVAGGANNNASYLAAAGGGYNNNASGYYSAIPGGDNNTASGQDSFAAGQNAQALHQGAFVWADSQPGSFASTGNDTFNVRAAGGVNILTHDASVTINGVKVATVASLGNFWQTTGNAGTSPTNGNFLGTTDNQPLEIRANNSRAMRFEPTTNGAPNVIGGAAVNFVAPGVFGATIAGGGATDLSSFIYSNSIAGPFGSIGGGMQNTIQTNSYYVTIGGGERNGIQSVDTFSVISGGGQNLIMAYSGDATIGGGLNNTIRQFSDSATIGGGQGNSCTNYGATVGGGGYDGVTFAGNMAGGAAATVGGGLGNHSLATYATVSGGTLNSVLAGAQEAAIGGGSGNFIGTNASDAAICSGFDNTIQGVAPLIGSSSVIVGGNYNRIDSEAYDSIIGGGNGNWVQFNAIYAVIGGGDGNMVQTNTANAVIGGGGGNAIGPASDFSTVGGGGIDIISSNADHAVIAGGEENFILANADHAVIGGGLQNQVSSLFSTVAGGFGNFTLGEAATIGGGFGNQATNSFATVPGGDGNIAGGSFSFAAGQQAQALHQGAFVWADSQPSAFASTGNDQFAVRAQGGLQLDASTSLYFGSLTRQMINLYGANYGIGVQTGTVYQRSVTGFAWFKGGVHNNAQNNPGTGGSVLMTLTSAGLTVNGTLASTSDRNAKEDFAPVNAEDVLAKVAAMPITKWMYKTDTSTRHIGPMAQDFYAAFAVGPDDKHITTVDEGGVALAAIQGLNQKLDETRAENSKLKQSVADLQKLVQSLLKNR